MKTTKLISALLAPALLVGCSDDLFEANGVGNNPAEKDLVEVTIATGIGSDAETRGTFAGGAKGVFDNFYFEPAFNASTGVLELTDNSAIKGDQVGLCLPSAAADGKVVTNVPFYIAGYETPANSLGAYKIYSLDESDPFYQITGDEAADAFTTTKIGDKTVSSASAKAAFNKAITYMTAIDGGTETEAVDVRKGIFRSVSGVMKGNYILYYPYNKDFTEQGKVPAKEIGTVQSQNAAGNAVHVLGTNLFAYSKVPFSVAGGAGQAAQKMQMAPAAYFFQFRLYNSTGLWKWSGGATDEIKLITVSTADNAAAFASKGYVSAGTTNSFEADAATAVDMIGVDFAGGTAIKKSDFSGVVTKEAGLKVYLSTYGVKERLAGKDIVVRIYTSDNKVAEIVKSAAGSNIVEGGTDYWNIDLAGVDFGVAERLAYNWTTLQSEVATEGTVVLKNNIKLEGDLTIGDGVTVNGANYTITVPSGMTLTLTGTAVLNTKVTVEEGGALVVGSAAGVETAASITTLNNGGTATVNKNAALTATEVNNGTYVRATASTTHTYATLTINATDDADSFTNGTLVATTLNNKGAAGFKNGSKFYTRCAGKVVVNGSILNTVLNNEAKSYEKNGEVELASSNIPSTLTLNNSGNVTVGTSMTFSASLNNAGKMTVSATKIVDVKDATIVNEGTFENNGTVTLLGSTTFTNKGTINDKGVFSGLSRLTHSGSQATLIRAVDGITNLRPALAEEKVTAIRINGNVVTTDDDKVTINTTKTIYINAASVKLETASASTMGSIVFEKAGATLIGNITTSSISVNENAIIGAKSNVTVNGNITIAKNKTLTANPDAYVICNDIKGEGSKSGPIYVK